MMTTQSKSTNLKSKDLPRDRRSLILGSVVATIIATTPYIFYAYESVPDQRVWNTFLFSLESTHYESAKTFVWVAMGKFLPLFLLFIWFFTCRHWWYHVLLIPMAMYLYQLFGTINDDIKFMDEFHIIYLLPIMAIIIPSIYLIRAKLFNKMNHNKSLQELEEEFTLRPKGIFGKLRDYF